MFDMEENKSDSIHETSKKRRQEIKGEKIAKKMSN